MVCAVCDTEGVQEEKTRRGDWITGEGIDIIRYSCKSCGSSMENEYKEEKKMEDFEKPVRINTRISKHANEWLDKRAKEMALTKTALISLAVENYIKETEVVQNIPQVMRQMEQLGIKVK